MSDKDIRYGHIAGGRVAVPVALAASQSASINNLGGKFVYMNDGAATICVDGSTNIFGWIEADGDVTYATGAVVNCIIDTTAVFRLPITGGTLVAGMIGDTCDLEVVSGKQGAQLDASSEDTVIVVGGDFVGNVYVDVMINPNKIGVTAIA